MEYIKDTFKHLKNNCKVRKFDYFQNRNSRKNLRLNDFADANKMDRHIINSIVEHFADVRKMFKVLKIGG